jgi:hypothetical protein
LGVLLVLGFELRTLSLLGRYVIIPPTLFLVIWGTSILIL